MNPQNERLRPEELRIGTLTGSELTIKEHEMTAREMQEFAQSLPSVEENPPIECKPEERVLPKPDSK